MKILISIDVNDMKKAVKFYTRAFGLKPARKMGEYFVELKGSNALIYLLQEKPGSQAVLKKRSIKRSYARHWTPVHLDLVVPDIHKAVRKAVKAGAKLEGPTRKDPYGYIARLSDPFGHGFCLIQQTRGYDAIADNR